MALYVIANNDYLSDGYVDASFVGTDSDLYVNVGYTQDTIEGSAALGASATVATNGGLLVESGSITSSVSVTITTADADTILDGVVGITPAFTTGVSAVATVSPGGDISVSATTSVTANPIKDGIVSIQGFQSHPVLWNNDTTWDGDASSIVWGQMLQADPILEKNGVYNETVRFTVAVAGHVTSIANIDPAGSFVVDASASFIVDNSADLSASATVAVDGDITVGAENIELGAAFSVATSGIFQVNSQPIAVSTSGTLAVDGDVIRSGVVTSSASATVTSTPSRTRPFVANLTSSFSLTSEAEATVEGVSINAGAFTTTVSAIKITDADIGISAAFGEQFKGGILYGGIIDIQGFATTLSALTIYTIDPFRVYPVENESRLLEIVEERRIYDLKSESRVNSIIEEIREYAVKSETRTLKTQHKPLIEVTGNPLNRRER